MSRGTTVKECKSYCNEGCGAIEWWEGGGQACYLCTDLSLLIEFPYTRDLSYPPHVFIKQSGMSGCVLFFCHLACRVGGMLDPESRSPGSSPQILPYVLRLRGLNFNL